MSDNEPVLSLEDLVTIVCDGNVEGELQERLTVVLRTDPRFTRQFEELDALAAECGAADLWEALDCNRDFDRLLAAPSWEKPADVFNPGGDEVYTFLDDSELNYRVLLAIADARLAKAADPAPIEAVKERLLRAEARLIDQTVLKIADPLLNLSPETADKVYAEARRRYLEKPEEE